MMWGEPFWGVRVSLLAMLSVPLILTSAPPTCRQLLDGMQAKLEANYAGFLLEVRAKPRQVEHDRMLAAVRRRAATTTRDACFAVLSDYIAWFSDPHLFVYQSPRLDTAETRRRIALVP